MAHTTKRRWLLWVGIALIALVALRFVVRFADATRRLPPAGELAVVAVQVLVLGALVGGLVLLVRRQMRRKR